MKKDNAKLNVKLFGRVTVSLGGKELKVDKSGVTSLNHLLAMLVYFRDGITKQELLDHLFADKNVADPNNNFRVTVFKLRRSLLKEGIDLNDYLSVKDDVYKWKRGTNTTCDVWKFRELNQKAERAEKADKISQEIAYRREACELYTDEFLSGFSSEKWVPVQSYQLKTEYMATMKRLCALLNEREEYAEVARLCQLAEQIYPYDGWQLARIDAMIALNRHSDALDLYYKLTELYFSEFGISPTEEMLERYEAIRDMSQGVYRSGHDIYNALVDPSDASGAAFVSYPNFIDCFRFLQRVAERNGESHYLVIVNVLEKRNTAKTAVHRVDEIMREVLKSCLRRTDTYTCFSTYQYLMLLVRTDLESVKIVTDRIDSKLSKTSGGQKIYCRYKALPVQQNSENGEAQGWTFLNEEGGE